MAKKVESPNASLHVGKGTGLAREEDSSMDPWDYSVIPPATAPSPPDDVYGGQEPSPASPSSQVEVEQVGLGMVLAEDDDGRLVSVFVCMCSQS